MEKQELTIEEEKGLSIVDILFIIRKNIVVILILISLFSILGGLYSKVETPIYESTGTMLVSYEGNGNSISSDYTFSNYISGTFVVFITQDVVLDVVSEKTGIKTGTLKKNVSVTNSSLILSVKYQASTASEATFVAQTIIDTAQEIADSVDEENKPIYHLLYDNLKVLSPAKEGVRKSHLLRDLAIGFGIGVFLAFLYVFLREILDTKFKSASEIERVLDIPVLAGIPVYTFNEEEKKEGGKDEEKASL